MFGDKPHWKLRVRVWVYRDGEKVLGPGRIELLGHIDRHGSISAAARQMNMSYRRAWTLVRDMNECAGEPLVDLATGGTGGGGARLTALGKEALAEYQRILQRLNRVAGGKARRRNRK